MKKALSLVLSLLLIASVCTAYASDPTDSEAYRKGFVEAVTHGTPISSHEFLLYYMIRADKLGIDIGAYCDVVMDIGSIVSLKYVGLTTDDKNNVLFASFRLPEVNEKDYRDALLYLISYVYAFAYPPSMDNLQDMAGKGYLDTATADINAIYASSKLHPFQLENYLFYYEDGRVNAEFVRR